MPTTAQWSRFFDRINQNALYVPPTSSDGGEQQESSGGGAAVLAFAVVLLPLGLVAARVLLH